MRHALFIPLLLLTSPALAAEYLFTDATIVTLAEAGTLRADLRVSDGRIAAIGADLEADADTVVVHVNGGYLMPGLAEMHAHVPAPDQGEQYRDDVLFLWLANGITTVRGMLGHPSHLDLRRELAAHDTLGPRLITSGPSFNGNSVSSPRQARQMVRVQAAAGYDFLKIHPGLNRAEYDAMADEARRLGMRFAGHVPVDVGLEHAVASGQATIDHLDGFLQALAPQADDGSFFGVGLAGAADLKGLDAIARQMLAAGSWVVPTETLIENFAAAEHMDELLARPEHVYLPADLAARYRERLSQVGQGVRQAEAALAVRKQIIRRLHDAGVGVLLGADSPQIFNVPGFAIHRELQAMVAAGLSPEEALRTGTVAPAHYFDRADDFGALRPGLSADLVWVDGDPTADIGNASKIHGVMVRGRWLDREELDAGLKAIADRSAQ